MSKNNNMLEAMRIVSSSIANQKKYDVTIQATIVGADENDNTHFIVESDSMRFSAYSQNNDTTHYRIDNIVNVLIPSGDYNNKKIILGKYNTSDEIPKTSMVLHPSEEFAAAWSEELKSENTVFLEGTHRIHPFTDKDLYIKLSADIISDCNFTITFKIIGKDIKGKSNEKNPYIVIWSSDSMIGDATKFYGAFHQEALLWSEELQKLNQITKISYSVTTENNSDNNSVNLSNLTMSFGYLKEDIKDDVYIYTLDDNYEYNGDTNKNIEVVVVDNKTFIYKDESNKNDFKYYLYTEGFVNNDAEKEENKILWQPIILKEGEVLNTSILHEETITSTVKVEYKDLYSNTKQFVNTGYEEVVSSGTLLLSTDSTYCPIFDNYGKAIGAPKKTVTAKRGDLQPFDAETEKYIVWEFDLSSQIQFPYKVISVEIEKDGVTTKEFQWSPQLPANYFIYDNDKNGVEVTSEWSAGDTGKAYVVQEISDAAAASSIIFGFKGELNVGLAGSIICYTQENKVPNKDENINQGVIAFTLGFGDTGGTGYAFNIIDVTENATSKYFSSTGDSKTYIVCLYSQNGEKINLEGYEDKIQWSWLHEDIHKVDGFNLLEFSDNNTMQDYYYPYFLVTKDNYEDFYIKQEDGSYKQASVFSDTTIYYTRTQRPVGSTCIISRNNNNNNNYHVLVATLNGFTLQDGRVVNLKAFYPIGISSLNSIVDIIGGTYGIYDTFNNLVTYNDKGLSYELGVQDENKFIDYHSANNVIAYNFNYDKNADDKTDLGFINIIHNLQYFDYDNNGIVDIKDAKLMGDENLSEDEFNNIFKKKTIPYYKSENEYIAYTYETRNKLASQLLYRIFFNQLEYAFYDEKGNTINDYYYGNFPNIYFNIPLTLNIYYTQEQYLQIPVVMLQNTWFSDALNTWDEKLKINEEENYILASMIGAGSKNSANQFTGVLMGKVGTDLRNAEDGIYGFKDGKRTFSIGAETGDAYFDGTVVAEAGDIGGWKIGNSNNNYYLYNFNETTEQGCGLINGTTDNANKTILYAGYAGSVDRPDIFSDSSWQDKTNLIINSDGSITAKQGCQINGISFSTKNLEENKIERGMEQTQSNQKDYSIIYKKSEQNITSMPVRKQLAYLVNGNNIYGNTTCEYENETSTHSDNGPVYFTTAYNSTGWVNYTFVLLDSDKKYIDLMSLGDFTITVDGYGDYNKEHFEIFIKTTENQNTNSYEIDTWGQVINDKTIDFWKGSGIEHQGYHQDSGKNGLSIDPSSLNQQHAYYVIINLPYTSNTVSVYIDYNINVSSTEENEYIVQESISDTYFLSSRGQATFGPWEFNGFGLKTSDENIILRPEGIYRYEDFGSDKGWRLRKTWAQLLE